MSARPAGRAGQLDLALGPFNNRKLFADHFLIERLPAWPEFADGDMRPLFTDLAALWQRESPGLASANEAQTEERWIKPILERLGFVYTVQAGIDTAGGRRQPDYALFMSDDARRAADALAGRPRYADAVAVADAKRFDRPLDGRGTGAQREDPTAQIINYVSITRCPWGVLTNGRLWRLYAAAGDLVEGACFEVDLVKLIESGDHEAFRYFAVLFGAGAFVPGAGGLSLLDRLLTETASAAIQVGDALREQVFGAVPLIAQGLLGDDERTDAALADAFDHALVFLYRLLFCLHAEKRDLLPVENPHYLDYSLEKLKGRVAEDIGRGRVFSHQSDDIYNDLRALFRIVDRGDDALGVGEYNGGLFRASQYPYFEGRWVPDELLAPALDSLSRIAGEMVDYRELSVRHLGTIYEQLLAYRLRTIPGRGYLALEDADGRHRSGSYFTPEFVVDAIVERTLEPLLERRSRRVREAGLRGQAALDAFLELKILDPAMGSGHFLVSATAWIAQYIATDPSYDGDLSLGEIQRLVAERCIYGVDLNATAVELAQLSLWLTTVQRGEPLTFLNNLRAGNALVGARVADLLDSAEGTVFADRLAQDARGMLDEIAAISARASSSAANVHEKEGRARAAAALREPLDRHADSALPDALLAAAGPALHWELEFPEVFLGADGRRKADGGFDAIIGNPPYVRIQELGRELADYCRRRFAAASGSFDVYIPFVEQALDLLAATGRLGFIMPNKLLRLEYGTRLRARLAAESLVEEIIDFGDSQLFPGATNYTAIFVFDRSERESEAFVYRRVVGTLPEVRDGLIDPEAAPAATFATSELSGDPWALATGEEARLLRHLADGAERLGSVTRTIFTGLQTGADAVLILSERGTGSRRSQLWSKREGEEVELEPDLLHPLASGTDVEPYAFRPLDARLLFPYVREPDGGMRLVSPDELTELPLTLAYLRRHEEELRARERGKMDGERWYAFGRTQSLGLHDLPKLGVAATVQHLEVAADPNGAVYFHNVRVNGILPRDEVSLWSLLTILNSTVVDWVFRRGAAEHANGYYAANKQFIAPLPIRVPTSAEAADLDRLGQALHDGATSASAERHGFLTWLAGLIEARVESLKGWTALKAYDAIDLDTILGILAKNRATLSIDPTARAVRERIGLERQQSIERLAPLEREMARERARAEEVVADLYRLSSAQRALIAGG